MVLLWFVVVVGRFFGSKSTDGCSQQSVQILLFLSPVCQFFFYKYCISEGNSNTYVSYMHFVVHYKHVFKSAGYRVSSYCLWLSVTLCCEHVHVAGVEV